MKKFKKAVLEEWNKRIGNNEKDLSLIDNQIIALQEKEKLISEKLPLYSSPVAIKSLEAQLEKIEAELVEMKNNKKKREQDKISMELVLEMVEDYMEHLEKLVFSTDSIKSAEYFRLLFKTTPTYDELAHGTPDLEPFVKLISDFSEPKFPNSVAVNRLRLESNTFALYFNRVYQTFQQYQIQVPAYAYA